MKTPTEHELAALDRFRLSFPPSPAGELYGAFRVNDLRIFSSGTAYTEEEKKENMGWEHVSVSVDGRCPTWEEMCLVKDMFWSKNEVVVQFHPKEDDYINQHPFCLHLWRKIGEDFETPPLDLV